MYNINQIEHFLNTEYKEIKYKEIENCRIMIKNLNFDNNLNIFTIFNLKFINSEKSIINLDYLECLKKRLNQNNFIYKKNNINKTINIIDNLSFIIKLIDINKKLSFSKLLSNHFITNSKFLDNHIDIVYLIIKKI